MVSTAKIRVPSGLSLCVQRIPGLVRLSTTPEASWRSSVVTEPRMTGTPPTGHASGVTSTVTVSVARAPARPTTASSIAWTPADNAVQVASHSARTAPSGSVQVHVPADPAAWSVTSSGTVPAAGSSSAATANGGRAPVSSATGAVPVSSTSARVRSPLRHRASSRAARAWSPQRACPASVPTGWHAPRSPAGAGRATVQQSPALPAPSPCPSGSP